MKFEYIKGIPESFQDVLSPKYCAWKRLKGLNGQFGIYKHPYHLWLCVDSAMIKKYDVIRFVHMVDNKIVHILNEHEVGLISLYYYDYMNILKVISYYNSIDDCEHFPLSEIDSRITDEDIIAILKSVFTIGLKCGCKECALKYFKAELSRKEKQIYDYISEYISTENDYEELLDIAYHQKKKEDALKSEIINYINMSEEEHAHNLKMQDIIKHETDMINCIWSLDSKELRANYHELFEHSNDIQNAIKEYRFNDAKEMINKLNQKSS